VYEQTTSNDRPIQLACVYVRQRGLGELYKNGWSDRDAVCGLTSVGPRNHVLDGVKISPREGTTVEGCRPTGKHCESLLRWMQQKGSFNPQLRHGIAIAAADCNAPDWSMPHYIVPRENSPPTMRSFVKILWPLVVGIESTLDL